MLPAFAFAIPSIAFSWHSWGLSLVLYAILRVVHLAWIDRVMPRYEREADLDALVLVRASTFVSIRDNGTSEKRYMARHKTLMHDVVQTIETMQREVAKAALYASRIGRP